MMTTEAQAQFAKDFAKAIVANGYKMEGVEKNPKKYLLDFINARERQRQSIKTQLIEAHENGTFDQLG